MGRRSAAVPSLRCAAPEVCISEQLGRTTQDPGDGHLCPARQGHVLPPQGEGRSASFGSPWARPTFLITCLVLGLSPQPDLFLPHSASCLSLVEMSTQGSKYINKEIQNAVKGVKEIKTLIEKTNEERRSLLDTLEEAKKKKEVRVSNHLCLDSGREGRSAVGCLAGLPW